MSFFRRIFRSRSQRLPAPVKAPAAASKQTEQSTTALPLADRSLTPTQLCQILYFRDAESRDKAYRIIVSEFGSLIYHKERRNARHRVMYEFWIIVGNFLREVSFTEALKTAGCGVQEAQTLDYRVVLADSDQCDSDSSRGSSGDVNAKDEHGNTALIEAVRNVDPDKVKALIAAGADVNARGNKGSTALIWAASNNDVNSIKTLIAAGANVNATSDDGNTALLCAACQGDASSIKTLIAAGANVNATSKDGKTALALAAYMGDAVSVGDSINALIAAGADVNAKDKDGRTALMLTNRHEIVAALKTAGATD